MDRRGQQLDLTTTINSGDYFVIFPSGTTTAYRATSSSVYGNYKENVAKVYNADYNVQLTDGLVLVQCNTFAPTVYLPNPTGCEGKTYIVKDWKGNAGSPNNITIQGIIPNTKIDADTSKTLSTPFGYFTFCSYLSGYSLLDFY